MIALLQRVTAAQVTTAGAIIATIDQGLLVFVAVEPDDGEPQAERLLQRLLGYRVFADAEGRMNRSVTDVGGGLLLVPQFTLAADTSKGTRPGFSTAAPPERGARLFDYLVGRARQAYTRVASGHFGADMLVTLTNDGPVTFWLRAT
jgi:D-tyrosyl-tRNA(Tyr) deacylase